MKRWMGILVVLLMLCTGCSGTGSTAYIQEERVTISPLSGSTLSDVALATEPSKVSLTFTNVPPEGKFLLLALPNGQEAYGQEWTNDGAVIHVAAPVDGGLDVGVIPLEDYSGEAVSLCFSLCDTSRSASSPPEGSRNVVTDLTWQRVSAGKVLLEWTEVNAGDYNFDSLVNINDLTPVGRYWGQYYSRSAPQARLQQIYWVDSNHDSIISSSDIQAIGANYGAEVAGYNVIRSGEVVPHPISGETPTITRSEAVVSSNRSAPPCYSVVLDGFVDESWEVIPLDRNAAQGASSDEYSFVDLVAQASVSGVQLNAPPVDSPANGFGDGVILRIIDPGDYPDSASIDERFTVLSQGQRIDRDYNSAQFTDVPRQRHLLLDIFYTPAIDLATGEANDNLVVTSVPFMLPMGMRTIGLDVAITAQAKPSGGYYLVVESIQSEGTQKTTSLSRIDYPSGTVSRINADDHSFDDEASLADVDRDGVSEARLLQTLDFLYTSPGYAPLVTIEGNLLYYDEPGGIVVLHSASQLTGGGAIKVGDAIGFFTELTLFAESEAAAPEVESAIDPSDLRLGDRVVLQTQRFEISEANGNKYWVNSVLRRQLGY
jgi:hypothetical protein